MRKKINRSRFWLFLAGGLVLAVWVLGRGAEARDEKEPKLKEILKNLQARYDQVKSMESEFEQVSRITNVEGSFAGQGRVFFQKPGKMRWEYSQPEKQMVISDGKQIWFYRPEDRQAIVNQITQAFSGKTPVNFLMGIGKIKDDFQIRLLGTEGEEKKNFFDLELVPKEEIAEVKKIVLRVSREDYLVRVIRIYDFFLNLNEIQLKKIELNQDLAEDLFTFKAPKGVKVIRPPSVLLPPPQK